MAFKHGEHGSLGKPTGWECPTCKAVNTGLIEAGCSACKAGADATQAHEGSGVLPPRTRRPIALTSELSPELRARVITAYEEWVRYKPAGSTEEAFMAGVTWALTDGKKAGGGAAAIAELPVGERSAPVTRLPIVPDLDEPRTRATLLAALLFYLDNQLVYGAVPGQLSAEETRALIQQLSPIEEPVL